MVLSKMAPRPIAVSEKGIKTKQRILEASVEVFAQKGFSAARMTDIAQLVGIRRASLVYYYTGKDELYNAALVFALAGFHEALDEPLNSEGTRIERLERMMLAMVDHFVKHPDVARLMLRELADADSQRMQLISEGGGHFANWADLMLEEQNGDAVIDPFLLGNLLFGAIIWVTTMTPIMIEFANSQGAAMPARTSPGETRAKLRAMRAMLTSTGQITDWIQNQVHYALQRPSTRA